MPSIDGPIYNLVCSISRVLGNRLKCIDFSVWAYSKSRHGSRSCPTAVLCSYANKVEARVGTLFASVGNLPLYNGLCACIRMVKRPIEIYALDIKKRIYTSNWNALYSFRSLGRPLRRSPFIEIVFALICSLKINMVFFSSIFVFKHTYNRSSTISGII